MAALSRQTVTSVKHWDENLFSFTTTRDQGFRFKNGHFTMIGLEHNGKPLMRAYSLVSANYEDQLEFFSIKVPDGPLTSKLQNINIGDELLVNNKPTGTLINDALLPGKRLWMLSTGTGLAPFLSIIKDPEIYEAYDQVILVHGVRYQSELAYKAFIQSELPKNEYFGDVVAQKLVYIPTVTRESYDTTGRITDLMTAGILQAKLGLSDFKKHEDRFMLCGSPSMLKDTCKLLDDFGFCETRAGTLGEYVIERAFVEC